MTLELLLARADDCQPVLRQGLAEETLLGVPPPSRGELPAHLWDVNSDPNDLSKQRWGIVAPAGAESDWLLEAVEPLRRVREEAQGAPVAVYRYPKKPTRELEVTWAMRWKKEFFRKEGPSEATLPRYLLLLGDLHELPLELQQVLATDAFVGRLAFPSRAGYVAYVDKVLRWEGLLPREKRARMLFYTSRDGTEATINGYRGLIAPSVEACRGGQQLGEFPRAEILELGGELPAPAEQLLAQAAQLGPGVLFSLSHGASGFGGNRRERQGALMLAERGSLMAKDVAARPFLPGGIWFFFACFSAGTPVRSSYSHWLDQLREYAPDAAERIASELLPEGEEPFIAALPQAVLANPEGPLAVMGHVDLAWSYGFRDHGRPTPSRFIGVLRALAEGGRAGVALHALQRFVSETSIELTMLYGEAQRKPVGRGRSPIETAKWAELWMVRQDLSNYILLGDPAVRLPLASSEQEPVCPGPPPALRAGSLPPAGLAVAEKAVLELLSGHALSRVADRHSVSTRELREWEELFRAAGRAALSRYLSAKE
ncbi:MAG: hypothetical protein JXB05_23675 [Myxococcaceae bacterium]|nr:hypothetical protein [Myxococcaceae bacterium]